MHYAAWVFSIMIKYNGQKSYCCLAILCCNLNMQVDFFSRGIIQWKLPAIKENVAPHNKRVE